MTLKQDIENINAELIQTDIDYGLNDRGQFYLQQFEVTGSTAALLEGHISMFSGAAGGIGFAANHLLSDYAETGALSFSYNVNDTVNEIYDLSQKVAEGFGLAVLNDIDINLGLGDLDLSLYWR